MKHILHGTWLPDEAHFLIWGEALSGSRTTENQSTPPTHPNALPLAELVEVLGALIPLNEPHFNETAQIWLPSTETRPSWSPDAIAQGAPTMKGELKLAPWLLRSCVVLEPLDSLELLLRLPDTSMLSRDLRYWQQVAQAAMFTLIEQRYIPVVDDRSAAGYAWHSVLPELQPLAVRMPGICRAVTDDPTEAQPAAIILESYMRYVVESFVLSAEFSPQTPELATFVKHQGQLSATSHKLWQEWQQPPLSDDVVADFRVCFRLEEPDEGEWYLRYMLQATDDPGILLEANEVWRATGRTFIALQRRFTNPHTTILTALGQASDAFPPVMRSLHTSAPVGLMLTTQEAYQFLSEAVPVLKEQGFGVLVPNWWKQAAKLKAKLTLDGGPSDTKGLLGQDALFNYEWQVAVNENTLTRDEFEELVALKQPLVRYQGEWIALDTAQVDAALRFLEKQPEQGSGVFDALHAMAEDTTGVDGFEVDEVNVRGWLADLIERLHDPAGFTPPPQPDGLDATLRPYQQRGFGWLAHMRELGLGACLADDMGLGKTIQAIALLQHEREQAGDADVKPALVVCPTSVIGNWRHEINRFAPALRVMRHHGPNRYKEEAFAEALPEVDVVITSYALLSRDRETLEPIAWGDVILDEAQNIKNPSTKKAQTARALTADFRLALTGTPVENRLSELWSIFQFLNPGYLGSQRAFREAFATPIERHNDDNAAARLRKLTAPFIMRRVKTDKSIISDLPDKFENKVYVALSAEQATLYEAVVREEMALLEAAEDDMARRGSVLRLLTRLKQVCNHPAHFLKEEAPKMTGRSGKLDRLTELLDEVFDAGQKALIFTQYAQMGTLLADYLAAHTADEVLYLHGGTPSTKREEMIDRFQSEDGPPLFILSLRAGGTGLTLTQASNVFHYDRWYNPAVEDQATDRAYRIGQRRDVQVHKLIALGTLEERIDDLLEHKKALADSIIGEGETFISEMSNDEIHELVALRED
jgi:SNF2 family DNA or RNA helicase